MGISKFPNGISSFGVPVLGGGGLITTGNFFFVNSVNGSNGNSGSDPDNALATIDYAVGLCTANKGDVIVVMPGHNESITSATSLVIDVAGISIIGLGVGQSRPVLDFDNTAGSIEVNAANCRMSNIVLNASVSAITVAVNVNASGCIFDNIETTYESTGDDFVLTFDVDTVNRTIIRDCILRGEPAVAGVNAPIRLDTAHNTIVARNTITGNMNAALLGIGAASNDIMIIDNLIYNSDTTTNNGIEITVTCTGLITGNRIGTLYATAVAELIDPGSCLCLENYAVNAIDESGVILPATTSA